MEDPLPPDPYAALGVPKTADATLIKSTYRKLALKCHPDKVADESKKAEATEKFHSIQQAYDILSDEERRERYDVQVKLAELRRQNLELRGQGGLRTDPRSGGYETRTAAPPFASFTARASTRVYTEERRPSYFEDDGIPRASARKFDYHYVKRPSPKDREREERRERAYVSDQDRKRAEQRRERESNVRESRDRKYSYVEDEFARYEAERRQRDKDEEARRPEAPRRPPLRREEMYPEERLTADAQRYMASQSTREVPRPSMPRRASAHEIPTTYTYTHVRRSAVERDHRSPHASSPNESSPSKAAPKRSFENAESYDRRPPTLSTQQSATPKVATPTETMDSKESRKAAFAPHRSYTMQPNTMQKEKMASGEPTIPLPRANTFPSVQDPINTATENSTSYKRTTEATVLPDSGYASAATPDGQYKFYPPPPSNPQASRTTYVYPKDAGSSNTTPKGESGNKFENYTTSGYRVEMREPGISGRRGSSPLRDRDAKPSSTAQKMAHLAAPRHAPSGSRSTQYVYPDGQTARPSMMGQSSSNRSIPRVSRSPERVSSSERERERETDRRFERERGRDRDRGRDRGRNFERDYYRDDRREKLYGEMGPGYIRDTQANSSSPYVDVEGISYSRRYRDEDVMYSGSTSRGSRERVYDDRRPPPSFSRSATMPVGAY